jgi:chromosome segregation ATPase
MNETTLYHLRNNLGNSEPNLKQANKAKVDTLINKTNELEQTFKQLNQTLNTPNFDIQQTSDSLSRFEKDFQTLDKDVKDYLDQHKDIIAQRVIPLKARVVDFTGQIGEIDNAISKIIPSDAALERRSFLIKEKLQRLDSEIRGLETKPEFIKGFNFYTYAEGLVITDLDKIETDLPILRNDANAKVTEIEAERARIEAEEKAKAAALAELNNAKIELSKNVTQLLNLFIPNNLEAPLNKETINAKAVEEVGSLRSEITKLKAPLISILENLKAPNVSFDVVAANNTLKTSQERANALKTQVDAFVVKNRNLNEFDEKAKTEQPAPNDFTIPVYVVTESQTIDGIKFELKITGLRYKNTGKATYEKESLG